jgi:hypothetical protein
VVMTIGIWSSGMRGRCKISTVESRLWEAADRASPRKTVVLDHYE